MNLGLAPKKLVAIDWDSRHLRLVQVRPRADGVDLLKAISVPIPSHVVVDDAESLGAFLREAMRQGKMTVRRAVLSVPREKVVLNTLNIPPSPPVELPAIVQFQVSKELPFAAEQATLDFAVCGRFDPKEASTILVAAVRNEQLDFYRNVAREAGLSVERIGLRPHANLIAILAKAPELENRSILVVEVGPQLTEIDIIRNGALAFSRAASVSLSDLEDARRDRLRDSRIEALPLQDAEPDETSRKAVEALMVEVNRSFEAYRAAEPGAGVDQIIVCGAVGLEPQLAESLGARFGAEASLYTPDRALNLSPQRAKELRGFSAALGLAIGHGETGLSHLDFLHPKKPISKRSLRLKKAPTAVLTAALVIASGVAFHFRYVKPLHDEADPIVKRINEKKKLADAVLDFKKQVDALEDWQDSEQVWPEVLVALTEVFPSQHEAFVTRLDLETKRPRSKKSAIRPSTVRMRLRTSSLGQVNELSAKLRDIGLIHVKTGKETPTGRQRGGRIYKFDTSIEAELPLRLRPEPTDWPDEPIVEEAVPPGAAAEPQSEEPPGLAVEASDDPGEAGNSKGEGDTPTAPDNAENRVPSSAPTSRESEEASLGTGGKAP